MHTAVHKHAYYRIPVTKRQLCDFFFLNHGVVAHAFATTAYISGL